MYTSAGRSRVPAPVTSSDDVGPRIVTAMGSGNAPKPGPSKPASPTHGRKAPSRNVRRFRIGAYWAELNDRPVQRAEAAARRAERAPLRDPNGELITFHDTVVLVDGVLQPRPGAAQKLAARRARIAARTDEINAERNANLAKARAVAAARRPRTVVKAREILVPTVVVPARGFKPGDMVPVRFADGETMSVAVNPATPIGSALLGAERGQTVTYLAPAGEMTVTVI